MRQRYREVLDIMEICLVHTALRKDLGYRPIRYQLIEIRDLLRNVRRLIQTVLEIHRPHDDHQLIHRLFIDEKLSIRAVIDFAADLILHNLHVRGAEVGAIQGIGRHVATDHIIRFRGSDNCTMTKAGQRIC